MRSVGCVGQSGCRRPRDVAGHADPYDAMVIEVDVAQAERALARGDRVMAALVKQAGPCTLRTRRAKSSAYASLAGSVVYQQLAGKAAAAILARVLVAVGGRLTPQSVLATDEPALRAAGLSGSKAATIKALAEAFLDGTIPARSLTRLDDGEIVARLTVVKGIGRWTAEMFLLSHLRRLDVWPVTDYGVRAGYGIAYGLAEMPTPKELDVYGEMFRPYRSVVAWYMWRAVDLSRLPPHDPAR